MEIGTVPGIGSMPAATPAAPQSAAADLPAGASASAAADTAAPAGDPRIQEERARANVENDKFNRECETCNNRKYVDGSNDPGVSFKSPQAVAPEQSFNMVLGHEMEHVSRDRNQFEQQGGKVLFQNVVLHSAICPDCGRPYIAGGETTTVARTGSGEDFANDFKVGQQQPGAPGSKVDENA